MNSIFLSFGRPLLRGIHRLLAVAPACCLLAAGPVLAQQPSPTPPPTPASKPAPDTTAYDIHRTYKAGEIDRYKLVNKMQINSPQTGGNFSDVDMEMTFKEVTKSVKPDGAAVITNSFESASADMNGSPFDLMQFLSGATVTLTQDKYGKVSSVKAEGFQGPMADANIDQMFSQSTLGFYPDKPVKIGDSWKFESNRNLQGSTVKVAGASTLVGIETVDGIKTYKIKSVMDNAGQDQAAKIHVESVGNVDAQTGKFVRLVAKVNSDIGTTKIKGDMTMTHLVEKAAASSTPAPKP